jgi:N-acetylglucosaminyl-diphospho-decaprenol L-rhamnosyltransferase
MRGFPTLAAQLALLVGLERYWPRNPLSRRQLMLDFDYERSQLVSAQPAGACLLCRRTTFESIGGFDEDFYYWFEDVDLVRRLTARGSIGYVHDAVFEHFGGGTFAQWSRADIVPTRYRSLLRYFDKHHSHTEFLALRAAVVTLALGRVVVFSIFDRTRARAYVETLRIAIKRSHSS